MKDAKGHGSDPHSSGVEQIGQAPLTPLWYHGSPMGEPGPGPIHVGTAYAAKVALEARIGIPADGLGWNGDREYGKTLLAGQDTQARLAKTGYNVGTGYNAGAPSEGEIPKNDYYATDRKALPTMGSSHTPIPLDAKPAVRSYQITGPMRTRVLSDNGANRLASRGKLGGMGAKYTNISEDTANLSAVVPDKTFLRRTS